MTNLKIYLLAAAIAAGTLAPANAGSVMVLGVGSMECRKALRLDWTATGITAWVQGYMTAQEGWVSQKGDNDVDFLPGEGATRVVGLVLKQCRASPGESVNDAAAVIAARLLAKYNNAEL